MSGLALSKLCLAGGVFVSFTLVAGAAAQPTSVPDFWAGDVGWVHPLNATFPPVQGSPSPVVQDPGHPFTGASWRIGDGAMLRLTANLSVNEMVRTSTQTTGTPMWGGEPGERIPPWSVFWHIGG